MYYASHVPRTGKELHHKDKTPYFQRVKPLKATVLKKIQGFFNKTRFVRMCHLSSAMHMPFPVSYFLHIDSVFGYILAVLY